MHSHAGAWEQEVTDGGETSPFFRCSSVYLRLGLGFLSPQESAKEMRIYSLKAYNRPGNFFLRPVMLLFRHVVIVLESLLALFLFVLCVYWVMKQPKSDREE